METVCGYPLDELIMFARLCRQKGIRDDELHIFVKNCAWAYDIIQREYLNMIDEHLRESIECKLN